MTTPLNDAQIERLMKTHHKVQFVYAENGLLWYRVFWLDKYPDGLQYLNDFTFPVDPNTFGSPKIYAAESVKFFENNIKAHNNKLRAIEAGKNE